jgi:hypothetical protein
MGTCFLALPEDAGDEGRSPFQRRNQSMPSSLQTSNLQMSNKTRAVCN